MSDPNQPTPPPYPGGSGPAPGTPAPPPVGADPGHPGFTSYSGYTGYPAYPGYPGYPPPVAEYAHWGLRVGAALLDGLLLLPFYFVVLAALMISADPDTGEPTGPGIVVMVLTYVGVFGFMIWNQIVRQGRTGSSLGKQWVGIRVVHEASGLPLGGWLTFGRQLLHILDQLACYVGYLWPLWDAKRQTFADKIVKSVVIRPLQGGPF
jgi:uncharacterized RDD family membrane protein YckC